MEHRNYNQFGGFAAGCCGELLKAGFGFRSEFDDHDVSL
jgi:hypothetical protein